MYVRGDGSLQFSQTLAQRGLPQAQWMLLWELNMQTGEQKVIFGPLGWPIFTCLDHPELGLYQIEPTTDAVVKLVTH